VLIIIYYHPSFSTVDDIPEYYFKENKLITGKVVTVHDGDGFRLFHEEEGGLLSCFSPKKAVFTQGLIISYRKIIFYS
jgi:hypothetical protein